MHSFVHEIIYARSPAADCAALFTAAAISNETPAADAISSSDAFATPYTERNLLRSATFFAGPIPGTSSSTDSRIVRSRRLRW